MGIARFFGVADPFFQIADPAAPLGSPSGGRVVCDFCGCALAADGAVLRTSARAKELARIEEQIERLRESIATLTTSLQERTQELTAARAELASRPAPPEPPAPRRGGLAFD